MESLFKFAIIVLMDMALSGIGWLYLDIAHSIDSSVPYISYWAILFLLWALKLVPLSYHTSKDIIDE